MNNAAQQSLESLREKITKEVLLELKEQKQQRQEQETQKNEEALLETRRDQDLQKMFLQKMQQEYPLYRSKGSSLYQEKYGQQRTFKKCTKFSKPISEQYHGTFKSE